MHVCAFEGIGGTLSKQCVAGGASLPVKNLSLVPKV